MSERSRFHDWVKENCPHAFQDEFALDLMWAAWHAGAWDALQQNTTLGLNLSQITQRLEELANVYADVRREQDAGSPLWKGR